MGYSLDFYSLPWSTLREELMRREASVIDAARLKEGVEPFSGVTVQAALQWRSTMNDLSSILRSRPDGSVNPVEATEDQAVAIAVMVRYLGSPLGGLDHASAAGKAFREFLDAIASLCFQQPSLLEEMTERPFLGIVSHQYPSWGGLSSTEVARMLREYQPPAAMLEEPRQVWLDELGDLLAAAQDAGTDLVTLYI